MDQPKSLLSEQRASLNWHQRQTNHKTQWDLLQEQVQYKGFHRH